MILNNWISVTKKGLHLDLFLFGFLNGREMGTLKPQRENEVLENSFALNIVCLIIIISLAFKLRN